MIADEVRNGPIGLLSLAQARRNFREYGASDRKSLHQVRKPRPEEILEKGTGNSKSTRLPGE